MECFVNSIFIVIFFCDFFIWLYNGFRFIFAGIKRAFCWIFRIKESTFDNIDDSQLTGFSRLSEVEKSVKAGKWVERPVIKKTPSKSNKSEYDLEEAMKFNKKMDEWMERELEIAEDRVRQERRKFRKTYYHSSLDCYIPHENYIDTFEQDRIKTEKKNREDWEKYYQYDYDDSSDDSGKQSEYKSAHYEEHNHCYDNSFYDFNHDDDDDDDNDDFSDDD